MDGDSGAHGSLDYWDEKIDQDEVDEMRHKDYSKWQEDA